MIKGIHHVGLSVKDIDRSLVFYRDALGMEVESRNAFSGNRYETILGLEGARGIVAVLKRPNLELELFEFSYPQPDPQDVRRPVCDHGITHFCIAVENIDHEYERLKAAGARPHCSPLDFGQPRRHTFAILTGTFWSCLKRSRLPHHRPKQTRRAETQEVAGSSPASSKGKRPVSPRSSVFSTAATPGACKRLI
jgi:glyoxylase I family protein